MLKEVTVQHYFCDLCGKEITGSIFSPIWGELKPDGDGNYERDGDIINADVCGDCKDEAGQMIFKLFQATEKVTEFDENSEKSDEKPPKNDKKGKKRKSTGAKVALDDGKIMALHRAGWSQAKIAEELGVSAATINRRIKEINASAFVEKFPEDRKKEEKNEDYD